MGCPFDHPIVFLLAHATATKAFKNADFFYYLIKLYASWHCGWCLMCSKCSSVGLFGNPFSIVITLAQLIHSSNWRSSQMHHLGPFGSLIKPAIIASLWRLSPHQCSMKSDAGSSRVNLLFIATEELRLNFSNTPAYPCSPRRFACFTIAELSSCSSVKAALFQNQLLDQRSDNKTVFCFYLTTTARENLFMRI